ncbi:MAG: hypothetical protein EOP00_12990 [Pedobacter sp.]|nr:MAG: hypothetical protein EOP00_12990 [Pedobacter sp.]
MNEYELYLPKHDGLDIGKLSRSFKHVSNSYKFYWFLAILDHISEQDDLYISLDELSLRMISSIWYPLDYFKLSFGKQDGFKDLSKIISSFMEVNNSTNAPSLMSQIEQNLPSNISVKLKHKIKIALKRWVTYRFLSPFFESQLKGVRDQKANEIINTLTNTKIFEDYAPYKIDNEGIYLSSKWVEYFKLHQYILRGFIKWNLVKFLQKNNPNVIGLSEKLEKPIKRDLKRAKLFWLSFITNKEVRCIYSNELITKDNMSLDHFIPWSYIAHDQLWNIIPTIKKINSAKGNSLPSLSHYLDEFCKLQYLAYNYYLKNGAFNKSHSYGDIFQFEYDYEHDFEGFKKMLIPEISNHYRTAEHLGFYSAYISPLKD